MCAGRGSMPLEKQDPPVMYKVWNKNLHGTNDFIFLSISDLKLM